jgi:TIR domain-containing protein
VPALIEQVKQPLGFRQLHAANLSGWDGAQGHEEFERFVGSITTLTLPHSSAPREGRDRIFLSYRREDSSGHVLALLPSLRRHFGAARIFKDTDNIQPGQEFVKAITHELQSCAVMLAIISTEWATTYDPRTQRGRLDNPDDFLRVEIAAGLADEHVVVMPVLIQGAEMPRKENLPADLQPLVSRYALHLSDQRWDEGVARLIRAIEKVIGTPPSKP